jgi:hypothetical protein
MTDADKTPDAQQSTEQPNLGVVQTTPAAPQKIDPAPKTEETKSKPPKPPILVKIIEQVELSPLERQTIDLARRTYWVTFLGLFFALGAAIFVAVQMKELADQNKILSDGAITQVANSISADRLAQKQLAALQAQVAAIQEQTQQEQRAWVELQFTDSIGASQQGIPIKPNQPLVIPVRVINTGNSPATQVKAKVWIELVKSGSSPKLETSTAPPTVIGYGVLFRNELRDVIAVRFRFISGSQKTELDPLTVDELQQFQDRKVYIAVYGVVTYVDVFNVERWTKFCGWSPSTTGTAYYSAEECTAYNSVGPEDKNPTQAKQSKPI